MTVSRSYEEIEAENQMLHAEVERLKDDAFANKTHSVEVLLRNIADANQKNDALRARLAERDEEIAHISALIESYCEIPCSICNRVTKRISNEERAERLGIDISKVKGHTQAEIDVLTGKRISEEAGAAAAAEENGAE